MASEVICIIGMHRSGTSMVARLLQRAGLYLGPEDCLLGADAANPEGHFEHTGFLAINDALLRHLGGGWDLPPRAAPGWQLDGALADLQAQALALVSSFPADRPWGWKEPRTTILLPFWKSIIRQPRFVICVRSPLDVAKSLASRNQMPIDHGCSLWSSYMRAAIKDTAGCPRQLVFYDDFFRAEGRAVDNLLAFCGLAASAAPSDIGGAIRSDLRHHRSEIAALLDDSALPLHAKLLYLGLRGVAAADANANHAEEHADRGPDQLLELLDEFNNQGQAAQLRTALAAKTEELSGLRHELQSKSATLAALNNRLVELQQHADRLQTFSDAVRRTWPYRFYRKFIKSSLAS